MAAKKKIATPSAADPFAARNTFGADAFDFDDSVGAFASSGDPFALAPAEEDEGDAPPLTMEGIEQDLEQVIEQDAVNAHQATIDAKKRYDLVDADRMETDFYFTVVFQNAKQREEFCRKSGGLVSSDDYYVDGMALAERMGIELTTPYVTGAKLRKAWKRLLGLSIKPGKDERY